MSDKPDFRAAEGAVDRFCDHLVAERGRSPLTASQPLHVAAQLQSNLQQQLATYRFGHEVLAEDFVLTPGSSSMICAMGLARLGNPYRESLSDTQGLVGIDLGVYGVPETFIIDKQGTIRHKQIGPVTPEALQDTILPLMRKLGA